MGEKAQLKGKATGAKKAKGTGRAHSTSGGVAAIVLNALSGRDGIILLVFIFLALLLFGKMFNLTVVEAEELSAQGSLTRTTTIELTARRGDIYDREGNLLATSVDAVTIYANPSKIEDPKETSELLAQVLDGNAQDYYDKITANPESTFVYIAKKTNTEYEVALKELNQEYINEEVARIQARGDDVPAEIITPLTGIEYLADSRREYPKGNTGAQIIGAVNDEGIGVSGLEQTYDSILRGVDGYRVVEQAKQVSQDSPLPMIDSVVEEEAAVAGQDIIISVDIEIQQYLELNLQAVANQRNCDNASAVILDGSTGEIIATASIPLYDRENITEEDAMNGATNAKAITQPYEPGSTFKTIIAGAAIEEGLMTAESTLFCPANLTIYDKTISDAHERNDQEMTLRQIVIDSSNVGVSLIEQTMGDETFYKYLERMNLGDFCHIDYPGETPGNLAELENWTPIQAANISFGQGVETSVLQIASIYGAIANDGEMVQPHFLIARPQIEAEIEYSSQRIFEPQTCRDLEELLGASVSEGTGVNAAINGYDVVGKTGTAEQADDEGGYSASWGKFTLSFAGYIDNSTSNYVFMSSFDNPANYSDNPATTFFSSVMSFVANKCVIEPQEEGPAVAIADLDNEASSTNEESARETATTSTQDSKPQPGLRCSTPRAGIDWQVDTSG